VTRVKRGGKHAAAASRSSSRSNSTCSSSSSSSSTSNSNSNSNNKRSVALHRRSCVAISASSSEPAPALPGLCVVPGGCRAASRSFTAARPQHGLAAGASPSSSRRLLLLPLASLPPAADRRLVGYQGGVSQRLLRIGHSSMADAQELRRRTARDTPRSVRHRPPRVSQVRRVAPPRGAPRELRPLWLRRSISTDARCARTCACWSEPSAAVRGLSAQGSHT
jgi:hypothetical protein